MYVPRDKYNTAARIRIEGILRAGFQGEAVETQVSLSESVLAQLHIIVHTDPSRKLQHDIGGLEAQITEAIQTWPDGLRDALLERTEEAAALRLFREFGTAFPVAYQEDLSPIQASYDIKRLAAIVEQGSEIELSLYQPPNADPHRMRFKVFHAGGHDPFV